MNDLPPKLPTGGKRSKRWRALYDHINQLSDAIQSRTPMNATLQNSVGFTISQPVVETETTTPAASVIPRWG